MSPGGLLLKKWCGELLCDAYYMCSEHDYRCYPCHNFCEETSNNYDANICEQQCQDYIHDYMKHYANDENIQEAVQSVQNLKALMICMTVLSAIAIGFIFVTLVFIWKRETRVKKIENDGQDSFFKMKWASLQNLKNKDLQMQQQQQQSATASVNTVSETVADPQTAAAAVTTCITSLAVTCTTTDGGTTTITSSAGGATNTCGGSSTSNKLPCEDASLEFSGYDNYALQVSPVLPGKKKMSPPIVRILPMIGRMEYLRRSV